jgi:hypothetical protein
MKLMKEHEGRFPGVAPFMLFMSFMVSVLATGD